MKNLVITRDTSLQNDVVPFMREQLAKSGYALLRMDQNGSSEAQIERRLISILAILGQSLSKNFAQHLLEGFGSAEVLPIHTEGIYDAHGVVPYFALACVRPSVTGGQTRIFDARMAAAQLMNTHAHLRDAIIRYGSASYAGSFAEHKLIQHHDGVPVLRYRSKTPYNTIVTAGVGEDMYSTVDACVICSLVCAHAWTAGDILFVNNYVTLHDRLPYTGTRKILRMRYDESKNRTISY